MSASPNRSATLMNICSTDPVKCFLCCAGVCGGQEQQKGQCQQETRHIRSVNFSKSEGDTITVTSELATLCAKLVQVRRKKYVRGPVVRNAAVRHDACGQYL